MRQLNIKVGRLIKKARLRAGLTQADLAAKLGYEGTMFVSLFENGKSKIPYQTLGELSVILPNLDTKQIFMMFLKDIKLANQEEVLAGAAKQRDKK